MGVLRESVLMSWEMNASNSKKQQIIDVGKNTRVKKLPMKQDHCKNPPIKKKLLRENNSKINASDFKTMLIYWPIKEINY